MESRFEDLTKEQLIAELNVATEKNKYLRDRVDQFEQEEKKREFERRLAEATDFLKANGYKIEQMPIVQRVLNKEMKVRLDAETMTGTFITPKPERIWRDKDMIAFAYHFYNAPANLPAMTALEQFKQRP